MAPYGNRTRSEGSGRGQVLTSFAIPWRQILAQVCEEDDGGDLSLQQEDEELENLPEEGPGRGGGGGWVSTALRKGWSLLSGGPPPNPSPTPAATGSSSALMSWHPAQRVLAVVLAGARPNDSCTVALLDVQHLARTRGSGSTDDSYVLDGSSSSSSSSSHSLKGFSPLSHDFQRDISCLRWGPIASPALLAVGCRHGICLWRFGAEGIVDSSGSFSPHCWMRFLQHPLRLPCHELAWSPQGRLLASCSPSESCLRLWDVAPACSTAVGDTASTAVRTPGGQHGPVDLLRWSPSGAFLFAASSKSKGVMLFETRAWAAESWTDCPCRGAVWDPSSRFLVVFSHLRSAVVLHVGAPFESVGRDGSGWGGGGRGGVPVEMLQHRLQLQLPRIAADLNRGGEGEEDEEEEEEGEAEEEAGDSDGRRQKTPRGAVRVRDLVWDTRSDVLAATFETYLPKRGGGRDGSGRGDSVPLSSVVLYSIRVSSACLSSSVIREVDAGGAPHCVDFVGSRTVVGDTHSSSSSSSSSSSYRLSSSYELGPEQSLLSVLVPTGGGGGEEEQEEAEGELVLLRCCD